jgi:multidrug efflux pump subunit AcrA (membrane-fusion protein)
LPVAIIAEKDCKLPFDIAQMRTIFFESTNLRSADQCRREIVAQLRQALERGAVDSPIATSIDVRALASGSTVERNIAEIITTIEDIARAQRNVVKVVERLDISSAAEPPPVSNEEARLVVADILVALADLREFAASNGDDDLEHRLDQLQHPTRFLARKYMVTTPPKQPTLDLHIPGYDERPYQGSRGD